MAKDDFPVEGFLVVRGGWAYVRWWLDNHAACGREEPPGGWEAFFQPMWEAVGVDPTAYRGMGRDCLDPWRGPPPDEPANAAAAEERMNRFLAVSSFAEDSAARAELMAELHEAHRKENWEWIRHDETDRAGRIRLYEFVGDNSLNDDSLLASAEEAEEVRLLLDTPSDWETIGVSQVTSTRNAQTLGFDIGWFGGEYYSLISDCVVAPLWHPPYDDDLPELGSQAKALNQQLLFDSTADALAFTDWYKTKPWAESETSPFVIVRIDSIS